MEERLKTLRESFLIKRKQVESQQEVAESLEKEHEVSYAVIFSTPPPLPPSPPNRFQFPILCISLSTI